MAKSKLKKGDLVKVLAGAHKGEQGPITWISKDRATVSVQGIEVLKHVKPSNTDTEGGIKKIPAKLNISNVGYLDPKVKNQTTRIGYEINDGKKIRVSRRSNQKLK
ncbi:50S ribosomal protein L24 [Williamsoniiplasma luminosum]|uniref:Large ribosomal subunit protein uL24 n=1 Tax=Williamsoniiplasma luminosum TaxID=214888 RepID=A0A2K8NTD1_9MOLU|nr:50S ribosomal protein L24 [Williamsoniiplasma luminosum]ATZ17014.1 50S ribosomal protein L24 [Williamsoniiplasma luminosum]AVP49679.1 MAG: 50S ribosomal protein L24 [Williamsoniiplasma luminosum]